MIEIHIPFPNKKYNIIYADPPWDFNSKQLQQYNGERFKSLNEVYDTVKTKDMEEWDVQSICQDDCAIFMWTTDAHLHEAIHLMEAWGFKYITVAFVWAKKTERGNQISTLGAWTMKNCELCLLGTKGGMLKYKKCNNVKQLVEAVRTEHSKKPQEVRDNIVKIFGDIPRIELFARQQTEGWDVWGNEVECSK